MHERIKATLQEINCLITQKLLVFIKNIYTTQSQGITWAGLVQWSEAEPGGTIRQYDVSFLPPLLLTFELPGDYPSSAPPSFTLTCSWLTHPQLTSLSDQLTDLYQATGGAVVLFSWIQFLREEALKQLDIHNLLELPSDQNHSSSAADSSELPVSVPGGQEVVPPNEDQRDSGLSLTASQILLSQILIHDAEQKQKVFDATPFDCGVCFSSRFGSECVQLYECSHIFCRTCLDEFWKAQITEGNVRGVTCPQVDCSATSTPAQVKSLVGEKLFHRYDRLLLQSTLDIMPDITYCPRLTCGSAVILEKSSPAAMCSVCSFAFCVDCKRTYHGTSKCYEEPDLSTEKSEEQLIVLWKKTISKHCSEGIQAVMKDYAKGSKQRRHILENKYGRKFFVYTFEKQISEKWITTNTKPCPHCFSPIQKDGGCTHMFCTYCKRDFTWQ
ncbi:E3 ubiquitin-protein ligase RNF14-like isoform X2 [Gambusia affinis]|uniref:E3 ubiquitin-protein ligase RNF14-like isoform X2 n=1 Tax=Gambusia affinis TaxID=33528 RepID=UPI001CDBA6F3|nr:E3 ubiquitin-protein ligase RNF14-like isoform X2 [Gambusia affinis]